LAVLLWAAPVQGFDIPRERVKPELAVERLKACGFEHVALQEDRDLQEEVLAVSAITQASEKQLRCAAGVSLSSITYVEFPEPLNKQYWQLYWRMEEDKDRIEARAWLERRGLLATLPAYVKGEMDDLRFARKAEAICGSKAKGAFIREHGIMTIKMGTIEHPTLDNETFTCLLNVSSASGFKWGFVGNEYYQAK
jgi:hypothetical protein